MKDNYLTRREYQGPMLDVAAKNSEPMPIFAAWYQAALEAEQEEPNAMMLATVDAEGQPHARMVLLKAFNEQGFQFFTNYQSAKAKHLDDNPQAALVLFWPALRRQVRIEGLIKKLSREQSADYFATRPRGSQLGANASKQSQTINSREELEAVVQQLEARYDGKEIPLPDSWGGYCLEANMIEFWQGQANRLHDRIVFTKQDEVWETSRLAP
jgi:pyridoxamine 5'-phosphate oxidase